MHQFEVQRRFALSVPIKLRLVLALFAYALLGFLAWRTMQPDKVRLVTFAILGMMAFRTVTHGIRMNRESQEGQSAVSNEQSAESEPDSVLAESRMPSADSRVSRE